MAAASKMSPSQKVMMKEFFDKYFSLLEKYWNPNEEDVYWDSLTEEAMGMMEAFQTPEVSMNNFVQSLIASFLNSREEML